MILMGGELKPAKRLRQILIHQAGPGFEHLADRELSDIEAFGRGLAKPTQGLAMILPRPPPGIVHVAEIVFSQRKVLIGRSAKPLHRLPEIWSPQLVAVVEAPQRVLGHRVSLAGGLTIPNGSLIRHDAQPHLSSVKIRAQQKLGFGVALVGLLMHRLQRRLGLGVKTLAEPVQAGCKQQKRGDCKSKPYIHRRHNIRDRDRKQTIERVIQIRHAPASHV